MFKSFCPPTDELLKINLTAARFWRDNLTVPFQIKSSPFLPRMDLNDCSPKTNLNASATFDLPLPFGPTIAVIGVAKWSSLFLANDLNPTNSNDFNFTSKFYHLFPQTKKRWSDAYVDFFDHSSLGVC